MSPLTKDEREIILTLTDVEDHWTVFVDSRRALSTRLFKIARALGIIPEKVGHGWQFTLPANAIRAVTPQRLTPAQREARRQSGVRLHAKSRATDQYRYWDSRTRPAQPEVEAARP